MKEKMKLFLVIMISVVISSTISITANTLLQASSISYKTSNGDTTDVNSALDRLFDINTVNERLGNTDISSIGDGTVTGAISGLNSDLENNLGDISMFTNDSYDSVSAFLQYCVYNGYLPDLINLIPEMTSNTTPSGAVSAGHYGTYNGIIYYPYFAFSDELFWHSGNNGIPEWISYKFASPKIVRKFTLQNVIDTDTRGAVKAFKLQASNDGSAWVNLGSYENASTSGTITTFIVDNTKEYLYYRIYVESVHSGDNFVRIKRIRMYE